MSDGYLASLVSGRRFGKFVSVGAVGAACDTAVLFVLAEVVGILPELAWAAGVETAILVMFAVNDRWTFASEGGGDRRSLLGRLVRSHTVRAGGVATQFVVFVALLRFVPVELSVEGFDVWLLVAKGSGVAVGMVVNYVAESLFTWRVHLE